MSTNAKANQARLSAALYAILFLFFFQLLSDFVESIYAFGLASTAVVVECATMLFLFSPVILFLFKKGLSGRLTVLVGELMLLARVVEPLLDTRGRMWVAGAGVACFMILFPSLLWLDRRQGGESESRGLAGGITLAVVLSILLRVLNSGWDLSTWSYGQLIGWGLAAAGAVLLPRHVLAGRGALGPSAGDAPGTEGGLARTLGLGLGLMGAVVVVYFVFIAANIVTRWTEFNYHVVVILLMLSLGIFFEEIDSRPARWVRSRWVLFAWNVVFVAAMVLTIWLHQIELPAIEEVYPIYAPPATLLHRVVFVVMLITFPIVVLDFVVFVKEVGASAPSSRALTGGFLVGAFWLAAMIFAHIFTTIYDYVPVLGPYFRDRFWCVHLAAGAALALPVLLVRGRGGGARTRAFTLGPTWRWALFAVALASIAGSYVTAARPTAQAEGKRTLRVLGYNIQQGHDPNAQKNFDGQLELMRGVDADIIGLSECDTNRIAGGNCDVVRYFADKLDMYSYYGPSPVTGTFGIALLSKFPIQNPRTIFLFSHGEGRLVKEQTAAILAEVEVGGETFTIGVTHLGNGGFIYQQRDILGELKGKENVVLTGDFNFRFDSDSYRLTEESLDDAWVLKWGPDANDRELDHTRAVDHIFVTPGTTIAECRYLTEPESDHPAIFAEIAW